MVFETLTVSKEGAVLFANIAAPPMNLLGPELVRDLVSLIQQTEGDESVQVIVFTSADPDYFISHVDVTRTDEYQREAAKLTGEASIALLFRARKFAAKYAHRLLKRGIGHNLAQEAPQAFAKAVIDVDAVAAVR